MTPPTLRKALSILAILHLCATARAGAPAIPAGPGSFTFVDKKGNPERPVKVWTWRPARPDPDAPVLVVMHGTSRNGKNYRDSWIRHASRAGALLVAPEFSELHYPGSKHYQLGNLRGSALVSAIEVRDWAKLRKLLRKALTAKKPGPLKRIAERVPKKLLAGFKLALASEKLNDAHKLALLKALNKIIEDKDFYAKESFPHLPPDAKAVFEMDERRKKAEAKKKGKGKKRKDKGITGSWLRRLNRALLAAALPGCFKPPELGRKERAKWTYLAVEHLFDHVVKQTGSRRKGYVIYGHSAGAQFVHRMLILVPECRAERAAAANAGKYLWPDFGVRFPYGLGGAPGLTRRRFGGKALSRKLFILAGTKDTEESEKKDPDLPVSDEARRQGKNRLERARNFVKAARKLAAEYKVQLGWELREVKGVAHSNFGMSPTAAEVLLGEK